MHAITSPVLSLAILLDMHTYAETGLVDALVPALRNRANSAILNIGSSGSVSVETALEAAGCDFVADHLDIDPRETGYARIRNTYAQSAEAMTDVASERYDACFSNFVWEHIKDVRAATLEAFRVTKPSGVFAFTVPNPWAPEFLFARTIPVALRSRIKKAEVWPTFYAYESVAKLRALCASSGFKSIQVKMFPAVYAYTYRFPVVSLVGNGYDALLRALSLDALMGHALVVCRK